MDTEGRHERGTEVNEPEARDRWGEALRGDDDDPLAVASRGLRSTPRADDPAVVLAAERERQLREGGPFDQADVLVGELTPRAERRDPHDAPIGFDLAVDGVHVHTELTPRTEVGPAVIATEGQLRDGAADELRAKGWTVHTGDPGDESDHLHRVVVDEPADDPFHVKSELRTGVWTADGLKLDTDGEEVTGRCLWCGIGRTPRTIGLICPESVQQHGAAHEHAWQALELAAATDQDGRDFRLLEGGAVDLAPRRKVQAWIDLRFQYVSDHPFGAPDALEGPALKAFGEAVTAFAELLIENGMAEGMSVASIVGHVLDKPGDPFPAS